jgi:hypothetical protein
MMNKVFHAPATISIQADVTLDAPARAGDSVRVEFYANTKCLGSGKSVWHDEMKSNPHSRDFQPMHITPRRFLAGRIGLEKSAGWHLRAYGQGNVDERPLGGFRTGGYHGSTLTDQ